MAANKRSQAQREHDRTEIASLYLQGKTFQQIADALQLSKSQIFYDLNIVRQRWRDDAVLSIDLHKARELARIDLIESETWRAWDESKKPRTVHTEQSDVEPSEGMQSSDGEQPGTDAENASGTKPKPVLIKVIDRMESRAGDPRFLQVALDCVKQRRELLGLDMPRKIAPVNPAGDQPYRPDLSDDEIAAKILQVVARVKERLGIRKNDDQYLIESQNGVNGKPKP